jgi:hypothetical protein
MQFRAGICAQAAAQKASRTLKYLCMLKLYISRFIAQSGRNLTARFDRRLNTVHSRHSSVCRPTGGMLVAASSVDRNGRDYDLQPLDTGDIFIHTYSEAREGLDFEHSKSIVSHTEGNFDGRRRVQLGNEHAVSLSRSDGSYSDPGTAAARRGAAPGVNRPRPCERYALRGPPS